MEAVVVAMLGFFLTPAIAQQPFATDNADVAAYRRWHLETNNEFDWLPTSSYPARDQDTQTIKFSYGAFHNCEVGMDFPLIAIYNSRRSRLGAPLGIGDADFSIKYNFRPEKEGSIWPAVSASLNIEPPTGNARTGLGSGLIDYYLNSIFQKTVSPKVVWRTNAGMTFAGNTATGAVGIRTRGTIFTGGASLVRHFARRLDLGVELYGGYTTNLALGRGELQQQLGGNYQVAKGMTLDFGFTLGQAVGSPRRGVLLGLSKDF
jgi:hypothetical protein